MENKLGKTLSLLCCVSSIFFIGLINCQPAPFFPTFAAREKHLTKLEIGIVFATLDLSAVAARLSLTHRIGTPQARRIFLGCNLIFPLSAILMALLYFIQSRVVFLAGSLFSRAVSGVILGLNNYVLLLLSLSWFPDHQSKLIGFIQSSFALSLVAANSS